MHCWFAISLKHNMTSLIYSYCFWKAIRALEFISYHNVHACTLHARIAVVYLVLHGTYCMLFIWSIRSCFGWRPQSDDDNHNIIQEIKNSSLFQKKPNRIKAYVPIGCCGGIIKSHIIIFMLKKHQHTRKTPINLRYFSN